MVLEGFKTWNSNFSPHVSYDIKVVVERKREGVQTECWIKTVVRTFLWLITSKTLWFVCERNESWLLMSDLQYSEAPHSMSFLLWPTSRAPSNNLRIHRTTFSSQTCLSQVVAPKKIKLAEAEESLAATMSVLNAKRAELKEVQDRLAELEHNFKVATDKKEQLEFQVCDCHALFRHPITCKSFQFQR